MSEMWNISSNPHIRDKMKSSDLMRLVLIALLPAAVFGVVNFGINALKVIILSVAASVLTEYVYEKGMHKKVTIGDYSAAVTGLLLALNLPASAPWYLPVLGSVFAILFVKQLFGGLGQNFMNPALAARCFLLISFAGKMTDFTYDAVSGATPLAAMKAGESVNVLNLFLGKTAGTIGETSTLAILIGAVILLVFKVIDLRIPLSCLLSFSVFAILFGGHGFSICYLAAELFGGGLMLGAWFMATDYVTSPITIKGKIVYGICLGCLTGLFRLFGGSAEGVSYAIIISNLLVPLIERITMPTAFGYEKNALDGEGSGISLKTYKPAISLLVITLVAGLALGAAYEMTKGPIQKAEEAAAVAAYVAVCPDAEDFQESDDLEAKAEELTTSDSDISNGTYGNIVFESVYQGLDASGNTAGYVVNVTSKDGFGGDITITVGISEDKKVTGMEFLTINETAGLGMNAQNPDFMNQFIGKEGTFNLVKDGASGENDIQALSGATITSTAVTNAMNAALYLIDSAAE